MDTIIKFICGAVDGLNLWVGKLVSWLIYPLIGIMTFEVAARYFFNAPQHWVPDSTVWLYGSMFMLTGGYAVLRRKHVALDDVLYLRLSPRGRAIIDVVFYLIFLIPLLIFLFPESIDRVMFSMEIGELSIRTHWRPIVWPFMAMIPVTFSLLMLQAITELLRALIFIFRGKKL